MVRRHNIARAAAPATGDVSKAPTAQIGGERRAGFGTPASCRPRQLAAWRPQSSRRAEREFAVLAPPSRLRRSPSRSRRAAARGRLASRRQRQDSSLEQQAAPDSSSSSPSREVERSAVGRSRNATSRGAPSGSSSISSSSSHSVARRPVIAGEALLAAEQIAVALLQGDDRPADIGEDLPEAHPLRVEPAARLRLVAAVERRRGRRCRRPRGRAGRSASLCSTTSRCPRPDRPSRQIPSRGCRSARRRPACSCRCGNRGGTAPAAAARADAFRASAAPIRAPAAAAGAGRDRRGTRRSAPPALDRPAESRSGRGGRTVCMRASSLPEPRGESRADAGRAPGRW